MASDIYPRQDPNVRSLAAVSHGYSRKIHRGKYSATPEDAGTINSTTVRRGRKKINGRTGSTPDGDYQPHNNSLDSGGPNVQIETETDNSYSGIDYWGTRNSDG